MMDKIRLVVPATMLAVGAYLLAISLAAGETVVLFGVDEVETRFGYLLGGIGLFGGTVVMIDMLFGGRPHRAGTDDESHHHSTAA